ncbi:DUF6387 family protein [Acinetobacter sp. Marseille-Q1623]|uniref:DUF6387 family protein n=1 Tax=Acinetobacter sp. Marseille-Q1623 TaxID=2697501 RepID=UPI00157B65CE|nr:DUF6387 family protein [Acinetobacter sp. Marseille-Q1623]
MKNIKNLNEIPSWFCLKNYSILDNEFDADVILDSLILRKSLLRALGKVNKKIKIVDLGYYDNWNIVHSLGTEKRNDVLKQIKTQPNDIKKIFEYIIEDPIKKYNLIDLFNNQTLSNFWVDTVFHAKNEYEHKSYQLQPIKDVDLNDLGERFYTTPQAIKLFLKAKFHNSQINNIQNKKYCEHPSYKYFSQKHYNYLKESKINHKENKITENISFFIDFDEICDIKLIDLEKYYEEKTMFNPIINVNLNCSDNLLIEQFKIWLKKQREENTSYKTKNNNILLTLHKIKNYSIFAFLDLYIWSLIYENKIQLKTYIDIIFPNSSYDENYISKTIIPFINKLFNPLSDEASNLMISRENNMKSNI